MTKYNRDNITDRELYVEAKRLRDLLMKRKKRLDEAIENDPTLYSKFGSKQLENIPMVSTKYDRVTQKQTLRRLQELEKMKTTTARGAKRHQEEMLRKIVNLPEGRLNKKQREERDDARKYLEDQYDKGEDVMSTFWKSYEVYADANRYRMLDSDQLLEEFKTKFNENNMNIKDLYVKAREWAEEKYLEEQKKNNILDDLEMDLFT